MQVINRLGSNCRKLLNGITHRNHSSLLQPVYLVMHHIKLHMTQECIPLMIVALIMTNTGILLVISGRAEEQAGGGRREARRYWFLCNVVRTVQNDCTKTWRTLWGVFGVYFFLHPLLILIKLKYFIILRVYSILTHLKLWLLFGFMSSLCFMAFSSYIYCQDFSWNACLK